MVRPPDFVPAKLLARMRRYFACRQSSCVRAIRPLRGRQLTHNRVMRMHRTVMTWLAAVVSMTALVLAQVPASELARPPANARHLIIQSTGGKHGDSYIWVAADGTRMGRESLNLRGQVFEVDSSGKSGSDGMPSAVTIRGVTPQGDAGESFTISEREARWKSPIDSGSSAYSVPAFYVSQGGPIETTAWFLETLLARPDKTLALLPGGKAQATRLAD